MKSISLYHDNGSFLTRLHPFSKLFYVLSAVLFPLLAGGIPPFFRSCSQSKFTLYC